MVNYETLEKVVMYVGDVFFNYSFKIYSLLQLFIVLKFCLISILSIIENAMFFVLEYTGFCLGRSTSADNESSATLQFPTFQAESYLLVIPKICLRHLMLPFDLSFITILLEVQLKYITIGQNIRNTINLRIYIFVRCLLARHPPISKKRESQKNRDLR